MGHLVLGAGLAGTVQGVGQSTGLEQAPQRRLADPLALTEHAVVVQELPEQLDGDLPVLDPVAADQFDDVLIERAEAAPVRAGLRQQGVQPPALVLAS